MITAKQARKLYLENKQTNLTRQIKEARDKEAAMIAKEHIIFINKKIEDAATSGEKSLIVNYNDNNKSFHLIVEHYKDQGFKVVTEGFALQIIWSY